MSPDLCQPFASAQFGRQNRIMVQPSGCLWYAQSGPILVPIGSAVTRTWRFRNGKVSHWLKTSLVWQISSRQDLQSRVHESGLPGREP